MFSYAIFPRAQVRFHMVGSEDVYVHPHPDNAMACNATAGCKIGKKAVAVAGGRLDVRGLEDPDACPSWTRLKSVLPVPSGAVAEGTGCALDYDMVRCWCVFSQFPTLLYLS